MPANFITVSGKKFMWDGTEFTSKETILDALQKYKKDGFEVELFEEEEGQKIYLYTRRVVKEPIVQSA